MSNVNEVRPVESSEQVPRKKIQLKKGPSFKKSPPTLPTQQAENPETVSQLKKDTSLFSPIVGKFNGKKVFLQGIMNKQLPNNCDFVSPVTSPNVQAAIKAVQKMKQKPQSVSFNEQQPVLINRKEQAKNDQEPKKGSDDEPHIKGILKGVPAKKIKLKIKKPVLVRPSTPEQVMLNCLDCPDMQDFIKGLQGEVKRLQDLSNELNMQIIMEGGKVQKCDDQPKQQEQQVQCQKTVCPQCTNTQLRQQAKRQQESQMPSNNIDLLDQRPTAPRMPEVLGDLVIKGGVAVEPYTGKAASRIRDLHEMRKVAEYEKEQINFVDQMKLATEQKQISLALGPKAQFARLGTPSRINPRNAPVLKSLNQQSQQN